MYNMASKWEEAYRVGAHVLFYTFLLQCSLKILTLAIKLTSSQLSLQLRTKQ